MEAVLENMSHAMEYSVRTRNLSTRYHLKHRVETDIDYGSVARIIRQCDDALHRCRSERSSCKGIRRLWSTDYHQYDNAKHYYSLTRHSLARLRPILRVRSSNLGICNTLRTSISGSCVYLTSASPVLLRAWERPRSWVVSIPRRSDSANCTFPVLSRFLRVEVLIFSSVSICSCVSTSKPRLRKQLMIDHLYLLVEATSMLY